MIRNLLTLIAFTISTLLPGIGFAQWFEADSVLHGSSLKLLTLIACQPYNLSQGQM
jgi:hypothetical protein